MIEYLQYGGEDMSEINITNALTRASEYRKNQLKDKNERWITVGMISNTQIRDRINYDRVSMIWNKRYN